MIMDNWYAYLWASSFILENVTPGQKKILKHFL